MASLPRAALPRLRTPRREALSFERVLLPAPGLEDELRALAHGAAPGAAAASFDERLRRYEWALTARRNGRLSAFILGQTRRIDGEEFVYLGPLYSRGGAFLPLFEHALRSACALPRRWALAMELENPKLLEIFRVLVPRGWPRPGAPLPADAHAAAQALAKALDHVRFLDEGALQTRCGHRIAQMVIVRGDEASAPAIAAELDLGLLRLRHASRPRAEAAT